MALSHMLTRAKRSLRDDLRLHLMAISSLVVAFASLTCALLGLTNLDHLAAHWNGQQRVTVYLARDASSSEIEQLQLLLDGLPWLARIEHVTAAEARHRLASQSSLDQSLSELPIEAFPASLEILVAHGTKAGRVEALSGRLKRLGAVDGVETYDSWFSQITALVEAGRAGALVLAALVLVCVLAVVASTIRLALVSRRAEIEVLKLCGATNGFVRGPFVIEGMLQGAAAALLALMMVLACFLALRGHLEGPLTTFAGVGPRFLHPLTCLGLVSTGALLGTAGSLLSLRLYLKV